ncbi:hypothetical protein BO71DRAFT_403551 [Aspergillus ellipticus CBS 707.79]|uniref:Uncharacterized protein n=1 Tax=Aspergillus ellipticus CBS 707.79 TaxID=1448320 RepID=A0A319CUD1_9EURO|nr:hypothetical protein BO71DRAFT_403551 [Aspergillus ellipticus CBS 707.79]
MTVFPDKVAMAATTSGSSSLTFALQALLHRHESYMAEAEEDRHRLLVSVDNLEREKRQVQAENARIIEENRDLLEQLEGLNRAVVDSDSHSKSLAARLESTEAELRKLTLSAARAADLEAQLAQMEAEQSRLQESLQSAQEDSKSAVQRWKQAECTLRDLHDQVDRIEKEAREERERQAELVQRMERRRAVERELDGAAGRLKGAAAAHELGRNHGGANVVSRFVRDILQDNANLQLGIIELREMLESSNEEVQNLRDQILSHQPLVSDTQEDPRPSTTLSQELESKESRRVSQEFHIHHHYHTPPVPAGPKKEKGSLFRRSKKRRSLGSAAILHSASGTQHPRKPTHRAQSSTSSASTILSQTSVSIPPTASRCWSAQSPTSDSVASSPQSAYQPSSIFDRVDRGFDSSQPTSPDSTVFSSPLWSGRRPKRHVDATYRTLDGDSLARGIDDDLSHEYFQRRSSAEYAGRGPMQSVIPEEMEDGRPAPYAESERAPSPAVPEDVFSSPYRSVRRSTSHESLFSVAGMDIHTPSRRPSRLTDLHSSTLPVRIPRRILSPHADMFLTPPVISTSIITAGREPAKVSDQCPQTLLASVAGSRSQTPVDNTPAEPEPSDSSTIPSRKLSLGRRVGGWVRGHWGTAAVSSNEPVGEESESPAPRPSSSGSRKGKHRAEPVPVPSLRFRYPGVNQTGPIMGFRPTSRAPVSVHAEQIDEGLLRESLADSHFQ